LTYRKQMRKVLVRYFLNLNRFIPHISNHFRAIET
jgi:hypothetical protein